MSNAWLIGRDFNYISRQSYGSWFLKIINDGTVACDGTLVNILKYVI
jgi:hypothetical protein